MTLQDVIDAEVRRGTLLRNEIHLHEADPMTELFHHEWCVVRPLGQPSPESAAVVMFCTSSPKMIHMIEPKILCHLDKLYQHDMELVRFVEDQ